MKYESRRGIGGENPRTWKVSDRMLDTSTSASITWASVWGRGRASHPTGFAFVMIDPAGVGCHSNSHTRARVETKRRKSGGGRREEHEDETVSATQLFQLYEYAIRPSALPFCADLVSRAPLFRSEARICSSRWCLGGGTSRRQAM